MHLDVEKIISTTDLAMLVRFEDGEQCWLPFSQISDPNDYDAGDEDCTVTITEWLAREKGLI